MTDDKTYEPFALADQYVETQVRIDTLGPCRRLVFAVRDPSAGDGMRAVTAKLILSAEAMIEIAWILRSGEPTSSTFASLHPAHLLAN